MNSLLAPLRVILGICAALYGSASAQTSATTTLEINDSSPQRSSVTSIGIRFSADVGSHLTTNQLRLKNLNTGEWINPSWMAMQYDSTPRLATWTIPGAPGQSLPEGNYLATLSASALLPPSPNRTLDSPGIRLSDQVFGLFRFYGDSDGDRDVDFLDTARFRSTRNKTSADPEYDIAFDVDRNGVIDTKDETAYKVNYFTRFPVVSGVYASLFNDTGLSHSDGLTSDPTIAGTVLRRDSATGLRATLAPVGTQPTPAPVDIAPDLAADGSFRLTPGRMAEIAGLPVNAGAWRLLLETMDGGAVSSSHEVLFTIGLPCDLTPAAGWTTVVSQPSGGAATPVPGSVSFANCEATLTEGDSFTVALERTLTLPQTPGLIEITYAVPDFDGTASGFMRDAFEAALIDSAGNPLTFTIQGSAGITSASSGSPVTLPPSPDAFFNHTDQKSPFVAPGCAVAPSVAVPQLLTISCDVSHLPAGSSARLVLRLLNNDRDHASSVRITDIKFKPADTTLDLAGSIPTALSLVAGSGQNSSLSSIGQAEGTPVTLALPFADVPKTIYGVPADDSTGASHYTPTLTVTTPHDGAVMAPGTLILSGDAIVDNGLQGLSGATQDGSGSLTVRALIDGRDKLVIRPDSIHWEHLNWTRVGLYQGPNLPTYLNGFPWIPQWPDNDNSSAGASAELPVRVNFAEEAIGLFPIASRYSTSIVQQPTLENGHTLIVDFNDNPPAGPSWYEVRLTGIEFSYAIPNHLISVTINGQPVDALDAAGNFFSAIDIKPGQNTFVVTATDAYNLTTTNTITVYGSTSTQSTSSLSVVSSSFEPDYGRTSFNDRTRTLYADVALRNAGTYPIHGPFYVGVRQISDPSVLLLGADGITGDGVSYYDFSATLANGQLAGGAMSAARALAFYNPNHVQFTYELVILGQSNQAPSFTSSPPLEGVPTRAYSYAAKASDPDNDTLVYSLVQSPSGMTLDSGTGAVTWTPAAGQLGNHDVSIRADDGRGGTAEQHFLISVINAPPNRPPVFISTPVTVARVSTQTTPAEETFDLSKWSVLQIQDNHQPPGNWVLSENNTVAIQTVNADPSFLLSDVNLANQAVSGTWRTSDTSDDDFMGFVFGFQDSTHFYLFDWKQKNQTHRGYAEQGMSVKVAAANSPLNGDDLWPTAGSAGRVRTIFHNTIPWEHNIEYGFTLEVRNGEFTITVTQGTSTLAVIQLADSTYPSGRFGVYNYSQGQVRYTGFTRRSLPDPTYDYDAMALDPDQDVLTYSLVAGPDGMTINSITGAIEWGPTPDQVGTHDVTIKADDGHGGVSTQSYQICVMAAEGNRSPIITSCPIEKFIAPATGDPAAPYQYVLRAIDPDGDLLSYILSSGPAGMLIDSATGAITWPISSSIIGAYPISVKALDNRGGVDFQTFTLMVNTAGDGAIAGVLTDVAGSEAGQIDHRVYLDSNENGVRDDGEMTRVIGAGANYAFGGLVPGSYVVALDPAPGYSQALPLSPSGSLLINTGFETVPVNFNSSGYENVPKGSREIAGWEVLEGEIDLVGSTFYVAASGKVSLDMNGFTAGKIGQKIPTLIGSLYQVRFQMSGNPSNPPVKQMRLAAGSQSQLFEFDTTGHTNQDMGWMPVTWEFVAEAAETQIVFEGLNPGNGGIALDDISIVPSREAAVYFVNLGAGERVNGCDFSVAAGAGNGGAPYFVTLPGDKGIVDHNYLYSARAVTTGSVGAIYDLISSPAGMIVEVDTGTVGWKPTLSQIGTHDVILRVQDGKGGVALQSFTITVTAPNSAPVFATLPPGPAVVDKPYRYVIRAQDAEEQALTFSLAAGAPPGMVLNAQFTTPGTTVLDWTPPLARLGANPVEIIARDTDGQETRQAFNLDVVASSQNTPPVFTSTPRTRIRTGMTYLDLASASDADGDPLAFELVSGPDGMLLEDTQPLMPNAQLLRWAPTATQLGDHAVTLRVKDGRGGDVDQTFSITVDSTMENQAPVITSNPHLHGTRGQTYEYNAVASDPDGDDVTWRLVTGPVGMSLDPLTGAIRWMLTGEQRGANQVTIEATDSLQATASQSWTIEVGCTNRSPGITSVPPTLATVEVPYLYAPRATDPDGDTVTWSLDASPVGMTIAADTGLVRWTPATNQTGASIVTLRASDARGGVDLQSYTIITGTATVNRLPVIVSIPSVGTTEGTPYLYNVRATDADSDLLTLQLLAGPTGAAITQAASVKGQVDGALTWTPAAGITGPQEFIVVATDPLGGSSAQRFMVTVRSNQAPVITSTAPLAGVPTAIYRYDVRATDADGDSLKYNLDPAPAGMTIDSLGRITWRPTTAQIGSHPVTVKASDGFGGLATQNFTIIVGADTEKPSVGLQVSYNLQDGNGNQFVRVGSQVPIRVTATDNVGVAGRGLTLDGVPVALNADGSGVANFPVVGTVQAVAEARDASGNAAQFTTSIAVVDPDAESTVAITIHSPANDSMITSPADVVASITSEVNLASYRLEFAELTSEASSSLSLADPSLVYQAIANVTVPAGTRNLTNAILGKFDPTLLQNGSYVVRVTAYDINQKGLQAGIVLHATGNLKLGEFRLEFTDLTVPLVGIPIEVKRVYDSRDSKRKGDFGYGWTLGVQNARVMEIGKVPFSGLGGESSTFTTRSRVYLTAPDGRRIGFKFVPKLAASGFLGSYYSPSFQADPGVYDTLESTPADAAYQVSGDGRFVGGFGLVGYDPTAYRLTTKENLVYEYDENLGLKKITDLNGNTVSFTTGGIKHSSGVEIKFTRDAQGRITKITDPSGKAVAYAYNANGDLITSTDRTDLTTQYRYHAVRAHYLDEIIDPLGRRAVKTEYGPDGRVIAVIDALGNRSEQSFDLDQFTGSRTDARGNVTELIYNEHGNVTQEKNPEGGIKKLEYADPANPDKETAIVDPLGRRTTFAYDARGNLTQQTNSSGTTKVAYNALNKPTTVTNALGQTMALHYDSSGHLDGVTDHAGNKRQMARDSQGRVAVIMDAQGNLTQFDYTTGCPCGSPGKVINPDGSIRLYEYNAYGQVTKETDETGVVTISSYDNEGKLLYTEDAAGHRTTYTYRGALQETVTNPLGHVTRTEYDDNNHPIKIIDAEGGIVRFEYDADGNRTKVIDPVGNVTTFVYDKTGCLKEEINTLGHKRVHSYDPAGNRTETIDRNGRRRTFEFDALNRMTKEKWWDGANVVRTLEYAFNELGLQTLATDPAARYDYTYDTLNRLKSVKSTVPTLPDFTLTYAYDKNGQTTSVTDNYGVSVGSEYDARNRLAKRTWQGSGVDPTRVDFTYDNAGRRTRLDRFIDLAGTQRVGHTDNAYNPKGLLRSITHKGPTDNVLSSHIYTYDAANRITDWVIDGQNSTYTYDKTAQLLTADYAAQPDESYTYDNNGNRTNPGYVIGPDNQLLADGTHTYTYDNEGNMVTRTTLATGMVTTFDYDYRNRLVRITDRDGATIKQTMDFVFDTANRRLSKILNGQATHFFYNRDDSWADLNSTNTVVVRQFHSSKIDELIARQNAGDGRSWYLTDHVGTVRCIAYSTGEISSTERYSSFGQSPDFNKISSLGRFGFTGRETEPETSLYFYRSRFLSPSIGRFITRDPTGFAGDDYNLYRYVTNKPNSQIDPYGNEGIIGYFNTLVIRAHIATETAFLGISTRVPIICAAIAFMATADQLEADKALRDVLKGENVIEISGNPLLGLTLSELFRMCKLRPEADPSFDNPLNYGDGNYGPYSIYK